MTDLLPPIIVAVLCVVLLAAAIVGAWRLNLRRRRKRLLGNRHGDPVCYTFVINPSKPSAEQVRAHITEFCHTHHIENFSFIDTQLDKDGRACAFEALRNGANVVIAVGGDGTVRTVASAMAGSGHAMGIIPIGTGNLFARNMGIPVDDLDAALGIAVSHGSCTVDIGRLTLLDKPDDDHGHAFLIIAGIGFDAMMIDDTDPELKKNISWLAYFVSGAKHLFAPKYHATVSLTRANGDTVTNTDLQFRTFLAGNCGEIPMFSLMPDATVSDGLLDFEIIDTTGGLLGWANLFGDVVHQTITGKAQQSPLSRNSTIDQLQGVSAEIRLPHPVPAQVDGDLLPPTQHLKFTVDHNALLVRVPVL
ncbi:diacylglycerol/lipid kinase family protein [Bifidobacterium magnum]|uniref:Diacylglycerol kinase catalytic domain containing protein n=1 Tax=Bifidobacterium magnum TaxID=1692 RepID=A0A087BBH5_9BIFI|nr:diacylglycerol kinase family protein [Bifidobacterium magnum]KFI68375.1 Diacylglycerol kinase catalytic domain containing protein [Bifidobacterium magnum]